MSVIPGQYFTAEAQFCIQMLIIDPHAGGATTIGTLFDSDSFAASSAYQTQEITFPAVTFDFTNNTYWLEVTLTKADASNQPAFGSAQINQQ